MDATRSGMDMGTSVVLDLSDVAARLTRKSERDSPCEDRVSSYSSFLALLWFHLDYSVLAR